MSSKMRSRNIFGKKVKKMTIIFVKKVAIFQNGLHMTN